MKTLLALQDARLVGEQHDGERGDVPGWVLITVMTAGLVMLLWGVAAPALSGLFNQAIASVGAP